MCVLAQRAVYLYFVRYEPLAAIFYTQFSNHYTQMYVHFFFDIVMIQSFQILRQ